MKSTLSVLPVLLLWFFVSSVVGQERDTFPPLPAGQTLSNFKHMWAGFDPRAEPLEVETIKEWEEDGVVLRIVRFRIGIFKGTTARLAAIYGFPKSGTRLPGLLQIHGGGQYADYKACLLNARRGYATVSIAWAGRISAPGYRVDPAIVKLFWEGKTDDPDYKLTTDWGAVDGYHAPGRNPGNTFPSAQPADWTLDPVESPRNSGWFLCAVAARRALTFLEQQPEVDPEKLGVYGHSMGGKLTVMTAVDSRVKAAAPSCGGISDRDNDSPLFRATLGDDVSLKHISCPIVFLSPSNDFHGRIGDLPNAVDEISSEDWRVTCSPHHNHQDTAEYEVATLLWFDQHLKGEFQFPQTPATDLQLKTNSGVPTLTVQPDRSMPILGVHVFYTQQGIPNETPQDREHTINRFWHSAPAIQKENVWTAEIPIADSDKPLWVYANVLYALETPVVGAGYYYREYTATSFNVSSLLQQVTPESLNAAGVHAASKRSLLIESFDGDWQQEWFTYKPDEWARTTHKLYDDTWKTPGNATIALDVRADHANKLVILLDEYAAEVEINGDHQWQTVRLAANEFKNFDGKPLANWDGVKTLKLCPVERLRPTRGDPRDSRIVGKNWVGGDPEFRNLRWEPVKVLSENSVSTEILDLFPKSVAQVPADRQGRTQFNARFTPSQSLWAEGLQEQRVFQMEMAHEQDADNSFRLRMGQGGQIYSLRGPFGESVPPSWRDAGHHRSPWNDEVWQFVAVCTKYNGLDATLKAGPLPEATVAAMKNSPFADTFFIHNSGAYIPGESDLDSLYCPLLASRTVEDRRCYQMLNWGLIPQIKTIHRSPLLYYTQVRDVGDGIIELTWVVHNFSVRDDVEFDHLNAPWGGTRISSLPLRYVSSPDGRLMEREDILNSSGVVDVRKTGGWNLSCASTANDSPSLSLVYGTDRHLAVERAKQRSGEPYCQFSNSLYRDWRASAPAYDRQWKDWRTRPANSFRNYDVCEVIPKLRIRPQTTIWYRSFLVVGRKDVVIKQAQSLVDAVDYGLLSFDPESTPMLTASVREHQIEVTPGVHYVLPSSEKNGSGRGGPNGESHRLPAQFAVFSRPVDGTMPLFQIQHTNTGQQVITTDPYLFVRKQPLQFELPVEHPHHDYYTNALGYSLSENQSNWKSLIGYGHLEKPASGNWRQLSTLLDPALFPARNPHHLDLWVMDVSGEFDESPRELPHTTK